ncbi:MAG: DUF4954 family protein [Sphaerochaetaceae bacterium]|nr:DUF4954 family protein [Sphaerochaetaceae bacterium]
MKRTPLETYGKQFTGQDEKQDLLLRDSGISSWNISFRPLRESEIAQLIQQGNRSHDWSQIFVEDPFDVSLIQNSSFYGMVRIGSIQPSLISYHDFVLPEGICDSHIVSCDINRHCAINHVAYISHYQIDSMCILHRIDEMACSNHSKFGVGVLKEGEDESVRVRMSIMNENEERSVYPFVGMNSGDAYLWGTYREHSRLMERLGQFTDDTVDPRRGFYGYVGHHSVIKSSRIIKDVRIGSHAYIKGANKLKNLTILSDEHAQSQIGEGVELVNGIIGYQSRIFYGVKAVRFITGTNSSLKYGARLINSFMGDNCTISCCEVLNSLVYPFHEQHHNNSFLIASLIQGQSNMAAGANIGSNHNTRGADGELKAKRGFWPALSSSLKFNSSFASFTLIAKGSYPNELNVSIPFSMISYNESKRVLNVMPAYWWLYNRYALARNSWKFGNRDKRYYKGQYIETDFYSIDTMDELLEGLDYLALHTGRAAFGDAHCPNQECIVKGKELLESHDTRVATLLVSTGDIERSKKPTRILKVQQGYDAYKEMILFSSVRIILDHAEEHGLSLSAFEAEALTSIAQSSAVSAAISAPVRNLGGLLVSEAAVTTLIRQIEDGEVNSWDEVHEVYDLWWSEFPRTKAVKALVTLRTMMGTGQEETLDWDAILPRFTLLCEMNRREIRGTREKDMTEPFRRISYRNGREMEAVLGRVDDNSFVRESDTLMEQYISRADSFPR